MAVPKKCTSKMKKKSRKSNWKQGCIKIKKVTQTFLIKTLIPGLRDILCLVVILKRKGSI